MTILHGDINKIFEIERDAFAQNISGGGRVDAYSFVVLIAPGTWYFNFTTSATSSPVLLHAINMSCNEVVVIQRIYLIKYPELTVAGDFYFYYTYTPKQFSLGDVKVDLAAANSFVRIYIENNAAGNRIFRGTIWYTRLT